MTTDQAHGILIMPDWRQIMATTWPVQDTLRAMQTMLGGYLEAAYVFDSGDVLYVNEEGMLRDLTPWRFAHRRDQALYGPGLIVGPEIDDTIRTATPVMTVELITDLVRWLP